MEIRVIIEGIDDAIQSLDGLVNEAALRQGLAAAAFYVEGQAKLKAPVDTGFLWNSIYSVTPTGSNYAQRYSEAKQANPKATMLSQETAGPLSAVVAIGAEYGVYQEMGTRFMRAQPFMRPAVENNRERIAEIIQGAIQRNLR